MEARQARRMGRERIRHPKLGYDVWMSEEDLIEYKMIEAPPKPNTVKGIKAALDKMGVKYKKSLRKVELINAYEQSLK